jgi:hypothetical protein
MRTYENLDPAQQRMFLGLSQLTALVNLMGDLSPADWVSHAEHARDEASGALMLFDAVIRERVQENAHEH